MAVRERDVIDALRGITLPNSDTDLVQAGAVQRLEVEGSAVSLALAIESAQPFSTDALREAVERAVADVSGVQQVAVRLEVFLPTGAPGPEPEPERSWAERIPGVRRIVAVASGKGGVGKSTVAANLALALAEQGHRLGLLDADIYGPSQQLMMGAGGQPMGDPDGKILPLEAPGGVKVMSIGFIIDPDQPVIWRGPMLMKALEQLFGDVAWGELDYLMVDLPPGTGDVALTLCQNVALAGAVIVTTPQDVALIDARKALNMFRRLDVPVLGIVENMSHFSCPSCGHVEHVFGAGGGERTARELGIPFLGGIPLEASIVATGDRGTPVVAAQPDSAAARAFVEVAKRVFELTQGAPTG